MLSAARSVRCAWPFVSALAVVDDVHLAAEDRLDALLGGGLVEVDRARHRAVVGERDGGHLELGRLPRERRDPARPVEDRVLGVDVQVDERRGHGRAIVLSADPTSPMSVASLAPYAQPSVLDLPRGDPGLDNADRSTDNEGMRQMPISLKLVAALSVLAEATAAALVFWHTGPRAR